MCFLGVEYRKSHKKRKGKQERNGRIRRGGGLAGEETSEGRLKMKRWGKRGGWDGGAWLC